MGFILSLWILVCPILAVLAWKYILRDQWYKPRVLESRLREQGIYGPRRSLVSGNIDQMRKMRAEVESTRKSSEGITHDIYEYILPHFAQWSKTHGVPFCLWFGKEPAIFVTDLDIIKEVMYNKSGVFWKPDWMMKFQTEILGRGLAVVVGEEWVFRRRFMTPAFHQEKIKGMAGSMVTSISQMLRKWEGLLSGKDVVEIDVASHFMELTADIISRTAFGSSYEQGHTVFKLINELGEVAVQKIGAPWIYGILPTSKANQRIKQIHRELDSTLDKIIHARLKEAWFGSDLLGLMLEAMDASGSSSEKSSFSFTMESLKEECKTFYVAGHETSSRILAWAMMLLAANKPWQDRARAEALEVCRSGVPDPESLPRLKVIGMILNETLRLYPPAVYLVRTAYEEIKVKDLVIPAGVGIVIPALQILHDKEVWGSDADEFHPERFEEGVANAAEHSFAFLPFGQGQRICIGQAFALAEAKLAVAMMLQRFSFSISPNYEHHPVSGLQLMPKHGIQLLVGKNEDAELRGLERLEGVVPD